MLEIVEAVERAAPARELIAATRESVERFRARLPLDVPELAALDTALAVLDPAGVESACAGLARIRLANEAIADREKASGAVAGAMPALAEAIGAASHDAEWDARLAGLDRACAWSVWDARLTEFTDPEFEARVHRELGSAESAVRVVLGRLAARLAWDQCLRRLTRAQQAALQAYQFNIRKIGKGTGKYAERYRAEARRALADAQEAVPAWIMPLHQVVDSIPMDRPELFDVVIVDEASQSGPEALLLMWLAKRIVVVGDDKQVSPSQVGLDHDQFFALRNRLIPEGTFRGLIAPTSSLFDIAGGLSGSHGRLMLKEHFRCMPEIINFSNRQWYGGNLQPLRQFGADRLEPLRAVHIADAYLEGEGQKAVNRAEAEELVDRLVGCVEDDAYKGPEYGRRDLLGAAQEMLIEDMIRQRIGVDEWRARQLRVGNAEAFQGDERDVMFLSSWWCPSPRPTGPCGVSAPSPRRTMHSG
ncbi:DEAD/DEAH box helicase [Yinghuangia aomiensis]